MQREEESVLGWMRRRRFPEEMAGVRRQKEKRWGKREGWEEGIGAKCRSR